MTRRPRPPRRRLLEVAAAVAAAVTLVAAGYLVSAPRGPEQVTSGGTFDVIVAGAGPGGVAAAIQAASMGSRVALLEPTDWVGGQMTAAGGGTMDEGSVATRAYGIYGDFARRATAYYAARGKSVHTCYNNTASLCVDPRVGQQILLEMIHAHPGIRLFLRAAVTHVLRSGDTVTGVDTSTGRELKARVVIDATEYGDLLPLAGAEYRVGTHTSSRPGTSCIQDITYTAVLKRYPNGVPRDLLMTRPPPGYDHSVAASFGAFVQNNGFSGLPKRQPMSFGVHNAYRGLPDLSNPKSYDSVQNGGADVTRTDVNLANDVVADTRVVEDPAARARTAAEAKLRTLQFLYYVQHDLGHTDWSIANDEGYDSAYNRDQNHSSLFDGFGPIEHQFPVEPYVRESRRIVGVETLTGADIHRDPATGAKARDFDDSVAIGYFQIDLHHCRSATDLEPGLDTPADLSGYGTMGPFDVPLGTLIPKRVNGLLAAEKNISASRVAASAIREAPVAFAVGQAAGALASLAASQHVAPRHVDAASVRAALTAAGAIVDNPRR